ncbi:MAG: carbohydrate kinase family protein [Promethearchaeota archaeon]
MVDTKLMERTHAREKKFDLVAIGSSTMDIIMQVDDIIRLDFTDRDGTEKKYTAIEYSTKLNVKSVKFTPGGSAANLASNLAQLGLKTAYVGVMGKDASGDACLQDMREKGVDVSHVVRTGRDITATSVILMTPWGRDRSILAYKGANNLLTPELVDYDVVRNSRAFAWTSLTTDGGVEAIARAIDAVKETGGTVLGAPSMSIIMNHREGFERLLAGTDLLSFNDEELEAATGEKLLSRALEKVLGMGPKIVCVTLGSRGSVVTDGEIMVETGTFPIQIMDTTGAGDAFASGILFGYLKGLPLVDMAKLGAAMASKEIMEPGVRIGVPHSEEELWDFTNRHELKQTFRPFVRGG